MRRLIDGPDRDWLTDDDVARWLGVSTTLFRQLVDAGRFPPPVVMGRGRKPAVWNWADCTAYMHLRGRGLTLLALPTERRQEAR